MQEKIIEAIKKSIEEAQLKINFNEQNINMNLRDLGLDSLAAMGVIIGVEDKLGVRLQDDQLINIKTGKELIAAFEKQLKK